MIQKFQKGQRDNYGQLCNNKLHNLEEMDKFLEIYNLTRSYHKGRENLFRPMTINVIEWVINIPPPNKSPGLDDFTGEFYRTFKEKLTPFLLKLFSEI